MAAWPLRSPPGRHPQPEHGTSPAMSGSPPTRPVDVACHAAGSPKSNRRHGPREARGDSRARMALAPVKLRIDTTCAMRRPGPVRAGEVVQTFLPCSIGDRHAARAMRPQRMYQRALRPRVARQALCDVCPSDTAAPPEHGYPAGRAAHRCGRARSLVSRARFGAIADRALGFAAQTPRPLRPSRRRITSLSADGPRSPGTECGAGADRFANGSRRVHPVRRRRQTISRTSPIIWCAHGFAAVTSHDRARDTHAGCADPQTWN